jgi:hypothetical protein
MAKVLGNSLFLLTLEEPINFDNIGEYNYKESNVHPKKHFALVARKNYSN